MRLPADCTLLPLAQGELLVSRSHATFCRVGAEHLAPLRASLADGLDAASLPAPLREALQAHGFFGAPREPEPESRSVQLQLTNACNLGCAYCCTNSGTARSRELPAERWLSLVDEIREAMGRKTRVAILGGEPFLVPFAVDLAERIAGRGLDLAIFTNGLPLREEGLARRVAALGKKGAQVRVSLAGPTRESCDAASGTARFDGALAGVHQLARCGHLPVVDVMLAPHNVAETAEHFQALRALLPQGTRIAIGILFHGGRETGAHLFGSRAEMEAALDRIAFEAGERIAGTAPAALAERREGCSCALGHHLHVRSDGALFTCFRMEEHVGDLSRETFADAVARVRAHPHPAATLPSCRDCALATLCGGGCRAENVQFTGDADVPVCGPWRVRVLSELLAEDRPGALEWPATHLWSEARVRGIEVPEALLPRGVSRHLID